MSGVEISTIIAPKGKELCEQREFTLQKWFAELAIFTSSLVKNTTQRPVLIANEVIRQNTRYFMQAGVDAVNAARSAAHLPKLPDVKLPDATDNEPEIVFTPTTALAGEVALVTSCTACGNGLKDSPAVCPQIMTKLGALYDAAPASVVAPETPTS